MFRQLAASPALGTLALSFVLLAGCADKAAPPAQGGSASGGVATDSAGAVGAAGGATAPAAASGPDTATIIGELPRRSKRDSLALATMTKPDSVLDRLWPAKAAAPAAGALLPGKRIVAFYGNPLEKRMGALGEYPKEQMLNMLVKEAANWQKADPSHPVVPALHMVVTTAQGAPGKNGLYRLRMKDSLVDAIHGWARERKAIFFVDVQLGMDNVQNEIPRLARWLEQPDVHLGLDPEFAMKAAGVPPGRKIGTMDAREINWVINWLDSLTRARNLPPKVLVVHRFTRKMVTNAQDIRPTPHVQVVIDMDGWGPPWLKFDSYRDYVKKEPVQYTGFKLFYHNDTKKGDLLLQPTEVLRLNPRPLYIQYQ